jgi:hypothetical protein
MRLFLAVVLGVATAVASAIVLGDYPLGGSVPWIAAFVIPFLIGAVMVIVADGSETLIWLVTGPLAATSVAWGVRIATGWGLDPVPASCWSAVAISLMWPPAWAFFRMSRAGRPVAGGATARPVAGGTARSVVGGGTARPVAGGGAGRPGQDGDDEGEDGSAGDGQLAHIYLIRPVPEVGDPEEHVPPGPPLQGEGGAPGDT